MRCACHGALFDLATRRAARRARRGPRRDLSAPGSSAIAWRSTCRDAASGVDAADPRYPRRELLGRAGRLAVGVGALPFAFDLRGEVPDLDALQRQLSGTVVNAGKPGLRHRPAALQPALRWDSTPRRRLLPERSRRRPHDSLGAGEPGSACRARRRPQLRRVLDDRGRPGDRRVADGDDHRRPRRREGDPLGAGARLMDVYRRARGSRGHDPGRLMPVGRDRGLTLGGGVGFSAAEARAHVRQPPEPDDGHRRRSRPSVHAAAQPASCCGRHAAEGEETSASRTRFSFTTHPVSNVAVYRVAWAWKDAAKVDRRVAAVGARRAGRALLVLGLAGTDSGTTTIGSSGQLFGTTGQFADDCSPSSSPRARLRSRSRCARRSR